MKLLLQYMVLIILLVGIGGCTISRNRVSFSDLLKVEEYSCSHIKEGERGMMYIEESFEAIVVWPDKSFMKGKVAPKTMETVDGWRYYDQTGNFTIRYSFWRNCSLARIQEYDGNRLVRDTGILCDF
jgi:hypothetical protein